MPRVTSAGVVLFFECKAMADQVHELANSSIPEYLDLGKGYGEHVSTVVVNLNNESVRHSWRTRKLTKDQLRSLSAQSEKEVTMSSAVSKMIGALKRNGSNVFPPVALLGLEAACKKFPVPDFSLFCGKIEQDTITEGALRELFEESTIDLHPEFIAGDGVEMQTKLRKKLDVLTLPLVHQIVWGNPRDPKIQHLFLVIVPKNANVSLETTGPGGRPAPVHISPASSDLEGLIDQLNALYHE
jgi:hypothetical protein